MLKHWVGGQGAGYHDTVWRAVVDTEEQSKFRRAPAYHDVLGVADYHARAYLDQLDDEIVFKLLLESEEADRIGGPVTYDFKGRQLAPNTVRYAKVLQDLVRFFPTLSAYTSIAEIGVGYGGQARLISEYAASKETHLELYDLIDILPVCLLAQAYLDHFRLYPACRYLTKSQISRKERWDLVISNYAFSEFDADLEQEYIELVLLKSKSGYLTMNSGLSDSGQWESIGQSCVGVEKLLDILPNAILLPEQPALTPSNYIIVYGEHGQGKGVSLDEMRTIEARLGAEHASWLKNKEDAKNASLSDASTLQVAPAQGRASFKLPFKKK